MLIDKYNRIIIEKLPANIATEVNQIRIDTDDFTDDELVEIYKDNFNDLFKIVESKHPEALKSKKKLVKKASEKKKIVKKAEPKKKLVKKAGLYNPSISDPIDMDAIEGIQQPKFKYNADGLSVDDARFLMDASEADDAAILFDDEPPANDVYFDINEFSEKNQEKIVKIFGAKAKERIKKTESKKKSVKTADSKVKLKSLTIHWAEGDNSKYAKFPKEYKTWWDANVAVIPVYRDQIEHGEGGYNKVKFTALFEDGETYTGRLDVSEKEDNPTQTNSVFGLHIKQTLDYDLSEKSKTSDATKKEVRDFLEKYDLGLDSKKSVKATEPIGPSDKNIDLSMLVGKKIEIYALGSKDADVKKITAAKVDDPKFSTRGVYIEVGKFEYEFPLSKLETFLEGKEVAPKHDGDKVVIILKNASEIDCETAIAEIKAIHAKREDAAKKRAEAPKKKVTTAAREKQIKTIASVFKTKDFKADKKQAQGFAKDLVAVYSKYGLKSMADQLEKDIQELIDSKYGKEKMAKGGKIKIYSSDEMYVLNVYDSATKELLDSKRFRERGLQNAIAHSIDFYEEDMKNKFKEKDLLFNVNLA